jgi:hypothetical protein
MADILFGIGSLFFIACGGVAVFQGFQQLKIFFDHKPCKIYAAAIDTNVHLRGSIAIAANLQSPFTKTTCAFWQCLVKETKGGGKNRSVITLYDQHSEQPLMITDGSGQIEVIPGKVKLRQPPHFKDRQGAFNRFKDPRSAQVLEDLYISAKGMLFKRNISIAEHVLQSGQDVYVWGKVVNLPNSSDRYNRQVIPKLMSDRPQSAFYVEVAIYCLVGLVFVLVGIGMFINAWRI